MFNEKKIVLQLAAVSDLQHGFLSKETDPKYAKAIKYLSDNIEWFDTGERGREAFRQLQELARQMR